MAMKRLSMVVAGGRITPLRLRAAAAPGCSFPPVVSCAARRQDQPILLKSRKISLCSKRSTANRLRASEIVGR